MILSLVIRQQKEIGNVLNRIQSALPGDRRDRLMNVKLHSSQHYYVNASEVDNNLKVILLENFSQGRSVRIK